MMPVCVYRVMRSAEQSALFGRRGRLRLPTVNRYACPDAADTVFLKHAVRGSRSAAVRSRAAPEDRRVICDAGSGGRIHDVGARKPFHV
jgi:hypothetical protein